MNFGSFVSFDLEYASPPLQNILRINMFAYLLGRLDGQQIIHRNILKISNMIFSYKLCHNKEDSNNLVLEFEYFFYVFIVTILNQDWYTSNTLMPLPFGSLFTMAVFSCLLG